MILTHSSLSAFQACPRKYEWRYVRRLRPAKEGDALRFGTAWHEALDAYWSAERSLEAGLQVLVALYDEMPAWADADAWAVERETLMRLLAAWAAYWSLDDLWLLASEETFLVPLRNPATGRASRAHRLAGKMDRRVLQRVDAAHLLMEHKTTSSDLAPESDYWKQLRIDSQVSRYLRAARERRLKVNSVLYDVVRKPTIRPKRPTNAQAGAWTATHTYLGTTVDSFDPERETAEMFGVRLSLEISERPEHYFGRKEVARTDHEMDLSAGDDWTTQKAIAWSAAHGFPRNTSRCLTFGRCPYADLCFAGMTPEDLETTAPEGFVFADDAHPELAPGEEF